MKKFLGFIALLMFGVILLPNLASCRDKDGEGNVNSEITESEPDSESEDNVVKTYNYDFDTEVLFLGRTYKAENAS